MLDKARRGQRRRSPPEGQACRTASDESDQADASFAMVPIIAIAGIILDAVEIVIERAEFLPDTLYERADVDPIPFLAPACDKTPAPHDVVDVAIGEIALGRLRQCLQDGEFGQGQFDAMAVPEGAADGRAELELAALHDLLADRHPPFSAVHDQRKALQDHRETARLADEVDGTQRLRRLL